VNTTSIVGNAAAVIKPETLWNPANVLDPGTWLGAAIIGIVLLVLAWLTGRAVRLAIHGYLDKAEKAGADPTGIRFLGQLAKLGVYLFAFLIYSHIIPPLQKLGTAWLTSFGVLSVVLGIAAQSTLGNLISGISLVLYRPFKLGDTIQVSAPTGIETGTVENINLGYTVVRTADDRRLVIPNNTMASQTSVNLTRSRHGAASIVAVVIASGSDVAAARKILNALAKAHPNTVKIDSTLVTSVSGAGTTLTMNLWCKDAEAAAALKSDLLESAKKEFDAAGIKFARWRDVKMLP
jgi:small-conductance mechanosensitive channel